MKTRTLMTFVPALALLAWPGIAHSAGAEEPAPLNTDQASCLLRISWDPSFLPLDHQTVLALLESAGVKGKAARQVFGEAADEALPNVSIGFGGLASPAPRAPAGGMMGGVGGFEGPAAGRLPDTGRSRYARRMVPGPADGGSVEGGVVGQLMVDTGDLGKAQALMNAMCERLEVVLTDAYENARRNEEQRISQHLLHGEEESQRTRAHLDALRAKRRELCEAAGRTDLSRDAIIEEAHGLEKEKLGIEMELAGQQARRDALAQRIADVGAKAKEPDDAARAALNAAEGKLKLLADKLKHAQAMLEKGVGPASQVQDDEIAVLEAEAELARRRKEMSAAAGGEGLTELNNELAKLSIDAAEHEARLRFVQGQLQRTKDLMAKADEYDRDVALELPLAQQAYETARFRVEELRRQLDERTIAPVVTVLGGK